MSGHACMCEHIDHMSDGPASWPAIERATLTGRPMAHRYGAVPAGSGWHPWIGGVCDGCWTGSAHTDGWSVRDSAAELAGA